jgi:hypothetical protein
MATTTTNFGWDIPQSTDLVKDGATAIAALGQDIDTAMVDLKGGTTGQVLAKASATDLDFSWVAQDDSNAIQNAIVDAKGDLIAATANDTPARLAVGTNGHVLTADSTAATGIKWAAAAGGGKVLQVVEGRLSTTSSSTSASFVDTGVTATITPSATSSKILVLVSCASGCSLAAASTGWTVLRGSTNLIDATSPGSRSAGFAQIPGDISGVQYWLQPLSINILDTPASTSALTYKVQYKVSAPGTVYINRTESDSNTATFIRGMSTITLMEIGA